jgi:hypothetical protein
MAGFPSRGAERAAKRSRGLLSSGAEPAPQWTDPAGYWNQVGAEWLFAPGGGIAGNPMSLPPDRSGEGRLLEFLAGSTPIIGEAMSARDFGRYGAEAYLRAQQGDYAGAVRQLPGLVLSGLGMVPLFGGITREGARAVDDLLRVPAHLRSEAGASTRTLMVSARGPGGMELPEIRVLQNPTVDMIQKALASSKGGQLRYLFEGKDKAVWDAYLATHDEVADYLRRQHGFMDPQYSQDVTYP